jgi:hypothetical protein
VAGTDPAEVRVEQAPQQALLAAESSPQRMPSGLSSTLSRKAAVSTSPGRSVEMIARVRCPGLSAWSTARPCCSSASKTRVPA